MTNVKEKIAIFVIINELLDIDSESSSDDDDITFYMTAIALLNRKKRIHRLQNYVEEVIPSYTDEMFKSHFRMSPSTFRYILDKIKPALIREKPGSCMISPEKQLLLAIWKMSTPDSYRSICEKFDVSRGTALLSVRRVIKALEQLAPRFIVWPHGDKVQETFDGFAAVSGFPKVIGAIDGTHINICAPGSNPENYIDRKGHHSIHLQAVCDHRCVFTHCYAGHVGSVHDQRVLRLSSVNGYLENPQKFPNDSHLLGDAAYALHRHLMTPYRDNGHLSERQKNYNFCHASGRMAIERAFGLVKSRFRSLLTVLDMQRVDLIPTYIMAVCVVHNICILKNDDFPIDYDEQENGEQENSEQENVINDNGLNLTGSTKRDRICAELPIRHV